MYLIASSSSWIRMPFPSRDEKAIPILFGLDAASNQENIFVLKEPWEGFERSLSDNLYLKFIAPVKTVKVLKQVSRAFGAKEGPTFDK